MQIVIVSLEYNNIERCGHLGMTRLSAVVAPSPRTASPHPVPHDVIFSDSHVGGGLRGQDLSVQQYSAV